MLGLAVVCLPKLEGLSRLFTLLLGVLLGDCSAQKLLSQADSVCLPYRADCWSSESAAFADVLVAVDGLFAEGEGTAGHVCWAPTGVPGMLMLL